MKQYVRTDLEAAAESGMIMRLHTRTIRPGVSCVAFTSSVMLDTCGMQRRKTSIAWRCCWWSYVKLPQLRERKRGYFSRGSRAFLHFHEDAGNLYVDVRLDSAFQRVGVTSANEQADLLSRVRKALQSSASARPPTT